MKIGIDVDNVINNLTECVISVYNEDTDSDLKLTDIIDYDMTLFVKPRLRKIFINTLVMTECGKGSRLKKERLTV